MSEKNAVMAIYESHSQAEEALKERQRWPLTALASLNTASCHTKAAIQADKFLLLDDGRS